MSLYDSGCGNKCQSSEAADFSDFVDDEHIFVFGNHHHQKINNKQATNG